MSAYETFKKTGRSQLQEKLQKKNVHTVPVITKIVVAMGIGSLATRKGVKDFSDLDKNLAALTGQRPQMIASKKSISNFKLREGMPSMLRVTLRREKAYDFITRIITYVLPRVRDFAGLSMRKFDGKGNYNLAFPSQVIFPELNPEEVGTNMGIQVTIVTSTTDDNDAKALLQSLGVIFQ